jgi:hypothetical protein
MYIHMCLYIYIYIYMYTYRLFSIANEEFGNTTVSISSKEYLFNFMSDMVLKIPYMVNPKEASELIISIEIDGMYTYMCICLYICIYLYEF